AETRPDAPKAEQAPDPNDPKFETYADYMKANRAVQQKHVDQRIKDAIASDRAEQSRLQTEQQQREAFVTKQQELLDSVKATEKRHPDFKEKVFNEEGSLRSDIQLNPVVD